MQLAKTRRPQEGAREETMTFFDNRSDPLGHESSPASPAEQPQAEQTTGPLAGDPITYAASVSSVAYRTRPVLPEDLRISWSWPHFAVFIFFTLGSFFVVQTGLALYYSPHQALTPKQLEQYLLNKPQFLFGTNILCYAMIFLFLYATLALLQGLRSSGSLGWRKIKTNFSVCKGDPCVYFFSWVV